AARAPEVPREAPGTTRGRAGEAAAARVDADPRDALPGRPGPDLARGGALVVKRSCAGAARVKPAVVVDVGWVNGLAAIRSLGRAGVKVLAVDHRRSALGFRSRYAEPLLSPDPQDEEAFVSFLAGLELDGPAPVFPTHDE